MEKIIALDADGVLLDYHAAYRQAWAEAFNELPILKDRFAYWAMDRWDVRQLSGDELRQFRACFNEKFWSTIPALPGAVSACQQLVDAGYKLVCVSAIETQFKDARLQNLISCQFPIDQVIATSNDATSMSPKAQALHALKPLAFVDDFAPYLKGISKEIHSALILGEPNGSPNFGANLTWADSQHADLLAFSTWWLSEKHR